ncbi:MAG TPA: ribonuclease Z [Bacteroidetes bacterium]|nr:ribonuclease Z [Bacteroidota bacterium]
MEFALTILGVSGALPAFGRFPTSQFLQIQNHYFLIDCGEGAQMRLADFGLPRSRINHIFISHLHGDHFFGLPGLLFSYALTGRTTPLHVYSPEGLQPMIRALLLPGAQLSFPLHFHTFQTDKNTLLLENEQLTVHTIPLRHQVPTCGFLFREKPFLKNIIKEKITELGLSIQQIKAVKKGSDLTLDNGQHLPNHSLTLPPFVPRSYAFISDTLYHPPVVAQIKDVDMLYHETTFCEADLQHAIATMHTTARQAATIAQKAGAGTLITGHYSSRYKDLEVLLEEARAVFAHTLPGREGETYRVERRRRVHTSR